ncbi:hypothetical protein HH308_16435 [Gordonia sp. TBRC 11910]|uniref:Uncharacterized protein n=1 Tax=Gordonia asplenii TaxID=2725283 RepID=A0A848L2N3_9ACTN|nr:hypothetical protein [Gordonia asplenii]
MLPIDPCADFSRRAWLPCPVCAHESHCGDCASSRNCDRHWLYLLSNDGTVVHLQCPDCAHLWGVDTRRGQRARRWKVA